MSGAVLFDPANQLLTISGERARLSPKAFSVLQYLHEHKQKLVTKDDLLSAVWPKVFVTDAVLKVAVGELRKALDDHPKQPTFIETVHRKGYRFIGEMMLADDANVPPAVPAFITKTSSKYALFGRDAAIQQLDQCWDRALGGEKQIFFINGEAGFGKTALISHWLGEQTATPSEYLFTTVSCFNQHDSSEPYLPILNALNNLLRNPQHPTIKPLLHQYAPSWLLQMPSLLEENELEALKQELFGVTKQRMLREFVDFIEAVTQHTALLLCIEDCHWCDTASLDLIMALAQRQSLHRFMLLGSFRTSELRQEDSSLNHVYSQITLQKRCETLALSALTQDEIKHFLEQRLPEALHSDSYAELFYRYTDGNPLMLITAIEHLNQSLELQAADIDEAGSTTDALNRQLVEDSISGGLKQLLNLKIANLDKADRQLLHAASVSNTQFATESIAAVLQKNVLEIEEACEGQLLHEQWLVPEGSENWPDGSISESYRFWHQLYRQFFYDTLSAARRRHYHLGFAKRLLSGYQGKLNDLAAQLAYHFEAGGDVKQAIKFRTLATQQAAQRFACAEAIQHITKVISLSESDEDPTVNLDARKQRCGLLLASGKLPDTIAEYHQLIEASQKVGTRKCEIDATLGLADALFWVDRQACLDTAEQAVTLGKQANDKNLLIHTQGKRVHYRSVIEGYQTEYAEAYEAAFKLAQDQDDIALQCVHYTRHLYYLIIRSEYRQANELAEKTQALALTSGDSASYLSCQFFHAWALFYEGRWGAMMAVMNDSLTLAQKNEHIPWILHFQLQKAWLLLHVFDYEGARALCLPIYQQASLGPANSLYFFSLIILMQLETKGPQQDAPQDYATDVRGRLAEQPMAIDWVLRFPLQQALSEHYLKQENWSEAKQVADELRELAMASGEQTYLVIADYLSARAALGEQQIMLSLQHLNTANQYLATTDLPMIAWRVHALADNQQAATSAINGLLLNMESEPELQQSFNGAEQIQAILSK